MDYTTVYSYPKAWKIDSRFYGLPGRIRFPVALDLMQVVYFVIVLGVMYLLCKVTPLARLPWIIRYGLIPFASAQFLQKKKLDGKNPIRYFFGWVRYLAQHGQYLERFELHVSRRTKERFRWYCAKGTRKQA